MIFLKLICALCALVTFLIAIVGASKDEKRLLTKLLTDLSPLERPVINDSDPILVTFGVTLMRIVNVDVENHHIELTLWVSMSWNATNLAWNPQEYNNISDTRIPTNLIWVPDIHAYNQVGENFDPFHKTLVVIKSNGNVNYVPPGLSRTSCSIDVNKYPFEEVSCDLKFGSWTRDGFQMDLEMSDDDGGDLSSFIKHPEWEVLGFPGKKNSIHYECCPEPFVDITYTLKLRRRGDAVLSSARVTILVIIGMLFISTLLNSSSAFKIIFALCSMILSVISATAYNPSPGKSEPPELAIYFSQLFFVSFSVLFSNVVVYNSFYKLGAAPEVVKKLLKKSPMERPRLDNDYVSSERRDTLTPHEQNYNDLQELTVRSVQRDQSYSGVNDWKYLSILMDKLFFIFWMIFIIIFHLAACPSYER